MTPRAHQAQQEWSAGYQHGLNGGDRPSREKGSAYYGGWLVGMAEREQRQVKQ